MRSGETKLQPAPFSASSGWKGMVVPLILFCIALYLWRSPVVAPIKYLTVFFHELSHGLAAVATGGEIVKIEMSSNFGGLCYTKGGNRFFVLSAGYLGSLLWGGIILVAAARTRFDREITAGLGILLLLVTLIWVRNLAGIVICTLSGIGFLAMARYTTEAFCDQLLRFIGLTSCFYVIIDIKGDLIDRSIPASDAYKIADMLGVPDWFVGTVWLVIAVVVTWKILKYSMIEKKESKTFREIERLGQL